MELSVWLNQLYSIFESVCGAIWLCNCVDLLILNHNNSSALYAANIGLAKQS